MKQEASLPHLRFGLFEVSLNTGELRKQGLKIRLGRHAFKLLALLLEHPGQLRTRDEIRQQLWGNGVFVNFDQSLNKAVHQLRDALGDDAANPHYIETVPERGYRFIYFAHGTNHQSRKRVLHSGRIAVLPFATDAASPGMELLNKILIETLIDKISLTPGLRVLAYSTVQSYRLQSFDPQTIVLNLPVSTMVIGDMTQSNGDLLLHVELINVLDGTQRWGCQFRQPYAGAQSDPGILADRIYNELRDALCETSTKRGRTLQHQARIFQMYRKPDQAHHLEPPLHSRTEED
jgi:DNA-binding winged helix-turn-helix (wHTH) protein